MKQEKLEEKAIEIFEKQGFEVEKEEERYKAIRDDSRILFQVFSSDKYSKEDLENQIDSNATIFVDESFRKIKDNLDANVSVLQEEKESKDYDLPSFELIGDIAVINDLDGRDEETVVEGIRENHPHIETIILKEDPLSGEFRVGGYRKLYGEKTETIHKEFGVRIKVDPTESYYSERFSTERKRVADQIKSGERVLVMFAGVGPFALIAASHSDAEKIIAVEKNPEAYKYLEENIEINNFEDRIEGYCGDVEEVLPKLSTEFDRIIMPLPGKADEFLALAGKNAASEAMIHYYRFMEDGEREVLEREIDSILDRSHIVERIVKCGEKSPSTSRVCADIFVE